MARCSWCEQEMTTARSCSVVTLHRGGEPVPLLAWGEERGWTATAPCGDCGVQTGGYHHLGCDIQECPSCRRPMISCGCRFDEDGTDDELELDGG